MIWKIRRLYVNHFNDFNDSDDPTIEFNDFKYLNDATSRRLDLKDSANLKDLENPTIRF